MTAQRGQDTTHDPGRADQPVIPLAQVRRDSFVVEPFTEACREVWERRQHVVLGASPGNSYFTVARLTDLLAWLGGEFARVDVVVPDSALEHTLLALGYDERGARKKARGEINVLVNRVKRGWEASGGPRPIDGLHRMSELESHPVYQERLAECEKALTEDPALWKSCAEMSREVLASRGGQEPFTRERVDRAMRYLVAELPFFLASTDIFDVPSSLNFYHRPLPLVEFVYAGTSLLRPAPGQGYATIRPAPA